MSNSTSPYPLAPPPHVPQLTFLGTIWGGAVVSLIFLVIRLYSRLKSSRRLFWDDGLALFSWFLALLTAILWQVVSPFMYDFMHVVSGRLWPPPPDYVINTERYYTGHLIVLLFFYTGLWSVKLSFLVFFRRLGHNISTQKYIWWPILFFTLATYFACIGDIQYKCLARPLAEIVAECNSDYYVNYSFVTFKANCALDVLSDFLIMIIPVTLIWNVRIQWGKKLALIGIFSLVIVTMVISIVRVVVNVGSPGQPDTTWLYLWSSVEQCVAIIISCLSAFPRLFSGSNHNPKPHFSISETYKNMIRRKNKPQAQVDLHAMSTFANDERLEYTRVPDNGSGPYSFSTSSIQSRRFDISRVEAQK